MERQLTLIGAIVATIIAVAVPAGHFVRTSDAERAVIRTEAQINARLLGLIVNSNPTMWEFELLKLDALLSIRNPDRTPEVRKVVGLDGHAIAEATVPLAAPLVEEREHVYDAGRPVATLVIQRSLMPVIRSTVVVAGLALLLALAAFFSVRILPVRRLRKARESHLMMATALDAAAAKEIQHRQAAEAERSRQQATLRALIDSLPDLIYYKDPQGRYLGCNKAFEQSVGLPLETFIGRMDADFIPLDRALAIQQRELELMQTRQPVHFEESVSLADGTRWMKLMKAPFWDADGKLIGTVGVATDITARKKAEDEIRLARDLAEDATRMKSDFLANMSHEIRTPMNAVLGLSHLLLKTELTARQRDFVRKVESSGQHLMGVINDILDFSKVEAGKLTIEHAGFNLQSLFDTVTTLVGEKSAAKGLELVFKHPANLSPNLIGDSQRLGQVLTNLVGNAVKFTEGGEILVEAQLLSRAADWAVVRFSVKDTGIGMTEEQVSKLFQSFHQADSSITRKYGGSGLGLAISKRFVELMGGTIGVDSVPGLGSTFWFTARLQIDGMHAAMPSQQDMVALSGRRALVVDDSDIARTVILGMLQDLGVEARGTSSGKGALQAVTLAAEEGRPYDLLYLDWKMPGMDGLETADRIASLGLKTVPLIVMVTAYDREEMLRKNAAVAAVDVLFKPVSSLMLMHASIAALQSRTGVAGDAGPEDDVRAVLAPIRGARILLVEDNDINQIVASEILADAGLVVDIAPDGLVALQMVQAQAYDLVLMDMQMPVLNGLDATVAMRKLPDCQALPIVAMTANAMEHDRKRCLDAGMDDFLSKPIDGAELRRVLLRWVRKTGGSTDDAETGRGVDGLRCP